ncbi:MAG: hydroxymethylbilane synthase, partial [Akkermansia muciniphila]
MTSKNTLIIGTRGSALALAQADMVCAALSLRYPELDVRREIIHTIGDRRTDVPLADVARVSGMVDKGIFIKELETALRDGRIDVAVHSLKDVPSELASGFT